MDKNSKIFIVGHGDILENSLVNYFRSRQFYQILSSSQLSLDVLNQNSVKSFFDAERPEYVFLASTGSGGIEANQRYAAEFLYNNLESQNNIINSAYQFGVKKLLYFMGSCAYPKESTQPIKEEYLLTGSLEKTSEPYAVAKIAGAKLCQVYKKQYGFCSIVAVPATVYGPGEDVNLETAHVIGALIGKFYEAVSSKKKEVIIWGSGCPYREFLFVEDFVDACLFLMEHYDEPEIINIGCGYDISIKELAELLKDISGFNGQIIFDETKPDGTMKKLMDNSRITQLGWKAKIDLPTGIKQTYQWYRQLKSSQAKV